MNSQTNLLNLSPDEIKNIVTSLGEKPFRGMQIFKWLYRGISDIDEMTDVSKSLRQKLKESHHIGLLQEVTRKVSQDDHTIKYLYLLPDNNIIECVLMEYHHGMTICLSTQVGCNMNCSFCASTRGGKVRNLLPGEMVAQILSVNNDLVKKNKPKISNIVLMGSGEPLDNYDNTIKFLKLVHHPDGLNIGYRSITLSTCGLVPKIEKLANEDMPVNLAISLHAPNQAIRKKLMPVAAAYPIESVIDASKYYFERTGRRVTFEYALIDGINDSVEHAHQLKRLLKGFPCHINIIPLNEIKESGLKRSNPRAIDRFVDTLTKNGLNVTKRREMGLDIDGACGQLRASFHNNDL